MAKVVVRQLSEADWSLVRRVRLAALSEAPDAFLSSFEHESSDPEVLWRFRLATRAIAEVDGVAVGMIAWSWHDVFLEVVGLWVDPLHRGGPAASDLVAFVRQTIAAPASAEVRIAVLAVKERAKRFYERSLFSVIGEEHHERAGRILCLRDLATT